MIEKILDKNNIAYKVIDGEGNTTIIKINGKLHMLYIHNKGNQFQVEREDRKSTRLNSSHTAESRMPSSA